MSDLVGKLAWHLKRVLPRDVFVSLKNGWKSVQSRRRAALRTNLPKVDARSLLSDLRAAGIEAGDTVFVHSSLSRIGDVDGGAATIVNVLREAVGENGTVVMPAYLSADDYVAALHDGTQVDLRTAKSVTGKITEAFRTTEGTRRSSHPFSSCVAAGARANYIVSEHEAEARICHERSPLARVIELDGKLLCLGTDIGTISLYHCAEDMWPSFPFCTYGAPFEGTYIDADGNHVRRELRRYDASISQYRIDQPHGEWIRDRLRERFHSIGLLKSFTFGAAPSYVIGAKRLFAETKALASAGITIYSRKTPETLAAFHELQQGITREEPARA